MAQELSSFPTQVNMLPTPANAVVSRSPKRGDQALQTKLLRRALAGFSVDAKLPYTPQIVQALRAAILTLKLMPGTPLSEVAVSAVLGLSRTPIREALKDLSSENLLEIFPQAGTVVSPIRLKLIEDGSFVRNALETANLIDLMHTFDTSARSRVQTVLGLQEQALEQGNGVEFFVYDEAMHRLFFELTGRLPVWDLVRKAKQHIDRARMLLVQEKAETIHRAYAEHLLIIDALFAGNEEKLKAAMQQHITLLKQFVLDYVGRTKSSIIVM